MTTHEKRSLAATDISEESVADYLQRHPDFFLRYTALLGQMEVPHFTGGAVSLVEYQVRALRDKIRRLDKRYEETVRVARDNERVADRVLRLTLALLETHGLQQVLDVLEDHLLNEFQADAVAIRVFEGAAQLPADRAEVYVARTAPELASFDNFFKTNRALCGRLKADQLQYLFPGRADDICSVVLIPVGQDAELGLLAIGSKDKDRYNPGMGTLFPRQIGALFASLLRRYSGGAADHEH